MMRRAVGARFGNYSHPRERLNHTLFNKITSPDQDGNRGRSSGGRSTSVEAGAGCLSAGRVRALKPEQSSRFLIRFWLFGFLASRLDRRCSFAMTASSLLGPSELVQRPRKPRRGDCAGRRSSRRQKHDCSDKDHRCDHHALANHSPNVRRAGRVSD